VFDLYDVYCPGRIDGRQFLLMAGAVAGGLAMAQALLPRYREAAAKLTWERTVSFFKTNLA
jgi:carboxymethylenebutenolidase